MKIHVSMDLSKYTGELEYALKQELWNHWQMAHLLLSLNDFLIVYYVPGVEIDTGNSIFLKILFLKSLQELIICGKDN